jgi:hypothetical protein
VECGERGENMNDEDLYKGPGYGAKKYTFTSLSVLRYHRKESVKHDHDTRRCVVCNARLSAESWRDVIEWLRKEGVRIRKAGYRFVEVDPGAAQMVYDMVRNYKPVVA